MQVDENSSFLLLVESILSMLKEGMTHTPILLPELEKYCQIDHLFQITIADRIDVLDISGDGANNLKWDRLDNTQQFPSDVEISLSLHNGQLLGSIVYENTLFS